MSETLQWIIVGVAIVGAMIAAFRLLSKKSDGDCRGCELKDACSKSKIKSQKSRHENLQNQK